MLHKLARLFRHRWADESGRVSPPEAVQRLAHSVAASEVQHLGEIRICIESGLPNGLLLQDQPTPQLTRQRALEQFGLLQVWDTECNNGVLIYLLIAERAIELVADRGVNQHVPPEVWTAIVERLGTALKAGRFEEGLADAVYEVSKLLAQHFPPVAGAVNPNELPDQPVLI
jgi:uncharacterized membrane protein